MPGVALPNVNEPDEPKLNPESVGRFSAPFGDGGFCTGVAAGVVAGAFPNEKNVVGGLGAALGAGRSPKG